MPEDLSQDNLSTWVETVQDVVAGMIAPQPEMSQTIFLQVVEVLTLLESVSRVTFCRQCYLPGSACRCLGVLPPPQLHPLLDSRGVTSPIQHLAPLGIGWGRHRIGTSTWISSHGRQLHLGSALCGLPKAPWSPTAICQPCPLLGGPLIWKANSWPSVMEGRHRQIP